MRALEEKQREVREWGVEGNNNLSLRFRASRMPCWPLCVWDEEWERQTGFANTIGDRQIIAARLGKLRGKQ